jgi:hypothetical protein
MISNFDLIGLDWLSKKEKLKLVYLLKLKLIVLQPIILKPSKIKLKLITTKKFKKKLN